MTGFPGCTTYEEAYEIVHTIASPWMIKVRKNKKGKTVSVEVICRFIGEVGDLIRVMYRMTIWKYNKIHLINAYDGCRIPKVMSLRVADGTRKGPNLTECGLSHWTGHEN